MEAFIKNLGKEKECVGEKSGSWESRRNVRAMEQSWPGALPPGVNSWAPKRQASKPGSTAE